MCYKNDFEVFLWYKILAKDKWSLIFSLQVCCYRVRESFVRQYLVNPAYGMILVWAPYSPYSSYFVENYKIKKYKYSLISSADSWNSLKFGMGSYLTNFTWVNLTTHFIWQGVNLPHFSLFVLFREIYDFYGVLKSIGRSVLFLNNLMKNTYSSFLGHLVNTAKIGHVSRLILWFLKFSKNIFFHLLVSQNPNTYAKP